MTVLLTGGSGVLGAVVARGVSAAAHSVRLLVREGTEAIPGGRSNAAVH
jgi:nucleoside-diphosphate-sugar epimerase